MLNCARLFLSKNLRLGGRSEQSGPVVSPPGTNSACNSIYPLPAPGSSGGCVLSNVSASAHWIVLQWGHVRGVSKTGLHTEPYPDSPGLVTAFITVLDVGSG